MLHNYTHSCVALDVNNQIGKLCDELQKIRQDSRIAFIGKYYSWSVAIYRVDVS